MKSSRFSSLASLLAVATMGLGSAMSPAGLGMGAPTMSVSSSRNRQSMLQSIRTGRNTTPVHSYPNGPGWTRAQVQRMARKKRNVKANRRNHRG